MKATPIQIRKPWPDEIPRLKPLIADIPITETTQIRIALSGKYQRIIGVALSSESMEKPITRLKKRFDIPDISEELINSFITD
ncbi:hypothetical protein [Rubritalea marina]|uniref:hypothetical protein n=1 Tax=Rubritalea marina TaxID=361055 RepID=UPI00036823AC|nr:hypothetical protein [Rubritalea marina]